MNINCYNNIKDLNSIDYSNAINVFLSSPKEEYNKYLYDRIIKLLRSFIDIKSDNENEYCTTHKYEFLNVNIIYNIDKSLNIRDIYRNFIEISDIINIRFDDICHIKNNYGLKLIRYMNSTGKSIVFSTSKFIDNDAAKCIIKMKRNYAIQTPIYGDNFIAIDIVNEILGIFRMKSIKNNTKISYPV